MAENHARTTSAAARGARDLDRLSIAQLDLPDGVLAPYVFGERKTQPAHVSVSLDLEHGFRSAAGKDALDQNTVHYGHLAKAIREGRPAGQTLAGLMGWVERAVGRLAGRADGSERVAGFVVSVALPKASMCGRCVVVCRTREGSTRGAVRHVLMMEGVGVMALIGVNAVERTARQPVLVDLELFTTDEGVLERDVEAFGLERELVQIIDGTEFETLESLGEHVVEHLQSKIMEAVPSCHMMSLTMRKPKAIAFAEAPALTLVRSINQTTKIHGVRETNETGGSGQLTLIKPYV